MNTPDKVIDIALSQMGYLEKSKAAYLADKSILYKFTEGAGSDNYTKYGKEMHDIYPEVMDFPAYWCAAFVEWCFYQAYGISTLKALKGNMDDWTIGEVNQYKKLNAYHKKDPKVGDQIFFHNGTKVCHTGLVYKVDSENVYTIEGNTGGGNTVIANGGGVAKKCYPLTYARIDGYGRPKYDVVETPKEAPKAETYPKWVDNNGDWYYRIAEGKNAHGWMDINHHRYYFNEKGKALTGRQTIEGQTYYFCTKELCPDLECALISFVEV